MTEPYEIRLTESLKQAWAIFARAPEVFVVLAFGAFAVLMVLSPLPVVGPLLTLLVFSLTPGAFFLAAQEGSLRDKITFQSLRALLPMAPQLLMLFVVKSIAVGLGLVFLLVPGIYLMVIFLYAELFVVLEGKNFFEALQASQELANRNLLGTFGLGLILGCLAGSGALLIGLGLLVTVPLALLALYVVFRHINLRVVRGDVT